jgi:hypothetical protein
MGGQGFYKRRRGIKEHIWVGTIDLLESGIHDFLLLQINVFIDGDFPIPAGVLFTSALAIHAHCKRRVSLRTVQRILRRLELLGWVRTWPNLHKRGNYPVLICRAAVYDAAGNEYRVNGPKTTDWRHPVYEPVAELSPHRQPTVAEVAGYRDIETIETLETKKKKNPAAKTAPPQTVSAFDYFWKVYPRKEAKSRAVKAWMKISEADYPKILADVECRKQTEEWQRDGGKFIPYAAKYLGERRWEDEPARAGQTSQADETPELEALPWIARD